MIGEALGVFILEAVDDLGVPNGAQRHADERLGFTPRKQGRAVRPGQYADFAGDRTNVRLAPAIGSLAVQNHLADDFFLDLVEHTVEHIRVNGRLRVAFRRLGVVAPEPHRKVR